MAINNRHLRESCPGAICRAPEEIFAGHPLLTLIP
jgi:hypothetical protein